MPGNYTHSTRAPGLILTASIYNADHQNHVNNMTPDGVDDASADLAEFRATADPGEAGTESLPTSLRGELLRLRKLIAEISGKAQWYESPVDSVESLNSRVESLNSRVESVESSRKPTVLDHGTKSSNYALDLSLAEMHLVEFSANATLTIQSSLAADRATVVVKSNGNTITLAGIDSSPTTLTAAPNVQDFIGFVKSFGKITAVAYLLNQPAS